MSGGGVLRRLLDFPEIEFRDRGTEPDHHADDDGSEEGEFAVRHYIREPADDERDGEAYADHAIHQGGMPPSNFLSRRLIGDLAPGEKECEEVLREDCDSAASQEERSSVIEHRTSPVKMN
ncbi:MAG: hypothetical protein JWL75_595 [Parcubacteria group bacterium]|nr:hypothetical protein [Parcubacteria group bacterium]